MKIIILFLSKKQQFKYKINHMNFYLLIPKENLFKINDFYNCNYNNI